jgi:hypothetical protein
MREAPARRPGMVLAIKEHRREQEETLQGQRVAYLRSIVRPAHSFGACCQTIAAENYRGNGSGSQRP